MFCKNCGAKLNEGAAFCGKCGSPVRSADRPLHAQARKKPMGMKWVVCGIAAAVIIVIIVISVVLITHLSDKGHSGREDFSDGEYSERNEFFSRGYSDYTDLLVAVQDAINSHSIEKLVSMSSDIININDAALRTFYGNQFKSIDDNCAKLTFDLESMDVEYIDFDPDDIDTFNEILYDLKNYFSEYYDGEVLSPDKSAIKKALDNVTQVAAVSLTAYLTWEDSDGAQQERESWPHIVMVNENGYWKLLWIE